MQKQLNRIIKALGLQKPLRARDVRRMKKRHAAQKQAERQAAAARTVADELRTQAHKFLTFGAGENQAAGEKLLRKAERKDEKALRLDAKATKEEHRAIVWKQRAKKKTQLIHGLKTDQASLEAKLAAMKPHVGSNGQVEGADNFGEAAIFTARYAAAKCAGGERPNFYSMTGGGFNVKHPLLRGSQRAIGQIPGERSDCSVFTTEVCWGAGLPDPNGAEWTGGFTGTLVGQHNGWRLVSEAEMKAKGWGYVVYGEGVGHHTEFYVGEGSDETIGHGSAPVDPGVIDLFGDGDFRCYIYDPKG